MSNIVNYLLILAIPIVGGLVIKYLFNLIFKPKNDAVSEAMLRKSIDANHLNEATINTNPNQNPPRL